MALVLKPVCMMRLCSSLLRSSAICRRPAKRESGSVDYTVGMNCTIHTITPHPPSVVDLHEASHDDEGILPVRVLQLWKEEVEPCLPLLSAMEKVKEREIPITCHRNTLSAREERAARIEAELASIPSSSEYKSYRRELQRKLTKAQAAVQAEREGLARYEERLAKCLAALETRREQCGGLEASILRPRRTTEERQRQGSEGKPAEEQVGRKAWVMDGPYVLRACTQLKRREGR